MSEQDFSGQVQKVDGDAVLHPIDLSRRINQLRQHLLLSRDMFTRQEALGIMRSLVSKLIQSNDTSNNLNLYARAVLLEAEGHELILEFSRRADEAAMKRDLVRPEHISYIHEYLDTYASWERAILDLHRDSLGLGDRMILVEVILIRLAMTLYSLLLQNRLGRVLGSSVEVREESIEPLIGDLYGAIDAAISLACREAELRGKMLLADYLEFMGRKTEAMELAREVQAKAKVLNYIVPLTRADDHLSGNGPLGAS